MISLERRIRSGLLVALLVILTGEFWLVQVGVQQLSTDYVASRLQHDAETLIATLQQRESGMWQVDDSRLPTVYQRVRSGHYYLVKTQQQLLRSRSLWDISIEPPVLATGETRIQPLPGPGTERWLTWSIQVEKQQQPLTVWVAEDITPLDTERARFTVQVLGLAGVTLLLLLVAQRWIVRQGFARLEPLQQAIRRLHSGELQALETDIPVEVRPLVDEIRRLLEQLSQRTQRSRTTLGNLAHELKRPLQRIRLLAERIRDERDRRELSEALAAMQQLLERELRRARIAGTPAPGQQFAPREDLPHLVEIMRRLHGEHLRIQLSLPPQRLPFDRDDLLELIGNLLDNACKFAVRQVTVTLAQANDAWELQVADDGPGVATDALQQLTVRGARLDERHQGHGLGLAICHDIAASYGGLLTLSPAPLGGLLVTVRLPISTAAG